MDVEKIRMTFRPPKTCVLFVGESPPAGGTFFYIGNSTLARYTQEGFSQAYGMEFKNTNEFLKSFMKNGFYLEDLCQIPVNNMDGSSRRRTHKDSVEEFTKRLKEIDPRAVITILVSIKRHVEKALLTAGLANIPHYVLPFPAMSHQQRYVVELSKVLHELHGKGIILGSMN